MNSMNDPGVVAGPAAGQASYAHRLRGLAITGFIAAMVMIPTLARSLRARTAYRTTRRGQSVASRPYV